MIAHLELKIKEAKREIAHIEDNIVACECSMMNFDKCKPIEIPHKHFVKLKIRKDSRLHKIMRLISDTNRPLHIDEICTMLWGDNWTTSKRNSLRGNLNAACEELRVFVRTAPQTYGLLELNHKLEK